MTLSRMLLLELFSINRCHFLSARKVWWYSLEAIFAQQKFSDMVLLEEAPPSFTYEYKKKHQIIKKYILDRNFLLATSQGPFAYLKVYRHLDWCCCYDWSPLPAYTSTHSSNGEWYNYIKITYIVNIFLTNFYLAAKEICFCCRFRDKINFILWP